jgi:MscS family membrane protein
MRNVPLLQAFSLSDFDTLFLNNRVADWIIAGVFVLLAVFLAQPIANGLARLAGKLLRKHTDPHTEQAKLQSLICTPLRHLIRIILFYGAVTHLAWPFNYVMYHRVASGGTPEINITLLAIVDKVFLLLFILQIAIVLSRIVDFAVHLKIENARDTGKHNRLQLFPLMRDIAKILLWVIAAFWTLGSVFAVNIPALIAGLGIGGVAIALAAKTSVENLFAAFTILTDKPFDADDTIKLGSLEGKVERIGFRSTRMRHADGSMFIIPNTSLVNEKIENRSQRNLNRVQLKVTLSNNRTPDELEALLTKLKDELTTVKGVEMPVDVALSNFGETTIDLMLTYHVPLKADLEGGEAGLKQAIALKVYRSLASYDAAVSVPTNAEVGKALPKEGPADAEKEDLL